MYLSSPSSMMACIFNVTQVFGNSFLYGIVESFKKRYGSFENNWRTSWRAIWINFSYGFVWISPYLNACSAQVVNYFVSRKWLFCRFNCMWMCVKRSESLKKIIKGKKELENSRIVSKSLLFFSLHLLSIVESTKKIEKIKH